ncbi:MAG: hypothetical protein J1E35_01360 [Lachnospiraceae bacterium]|nr:hypothetical protein [Lachnospiraceae bacterium]
MCLVSVLGDSKYEYRSFTHILNTEDSVSFLAYGIELYARDVTGCTKLDCIHGITTRYEKINELLDILNRTQVYPCHFRDIVEDFLS